MTQGPPSSADRGLRRRVFEALPAQARRPVEQGYAAALRALSLRASRRPFRPIATRRDVDACYRLLLGRVPDERGYRGHLNLVAVRPVPLDELVGHFLGSPEFRHRLDGALGGADSDLQPVDLDNGLRLWVRSDDSTVGGDIRRSGRYEEAVSEELVRRLRPGSTFVDIGASLGYFTVLAGRAVGPTGRVIACEPGPQNQTVLLLNTMVNSLDNVRIVPAAAGAARGALLYHRLGGNGSVAEFSGDPASIGSRDLVPADTLDNILAAEPAVHVIKMDVEGAEGLVLAGARQTLLRHRPVLVFEFAPPSLEEISGVSGPAFLDQLATLGYGFSLPGGSRLEPSQLMEHYRRQPSDHVNVVAVAGAASTAG